MALANSYHLRKSNKERNVYILTKRLTIFITIKNSVKFDELELILLTRILNTDLKLYLLNKKLAHKIKKAYKKNKYKLRALRYLLKKPFSR